MLVKVRANFKIEEDSNVSDLLEIKAKVWYSIPEKFGFKKSKSLEVEVATFSGIEQLLHFHEIADLKDTAKAVIQKEIRLDIMKRLKNHVEISSEEQKAQVLNMLNQMKLTFDFDVDHAKQSLEVEQKQLNPSDFGKTHGDYFNLGGNKCKLDDDVFQ